MRERIALDVSDYLVVENDRNICVGRFSTREEALARARELEQE
jgi:hypothetical protein